MTIKNSIQLLCLSLLFFINTLNAQQDVQKGDFTIGETLTFQSSELGEERVLNVYLPASYGINAEQKYPVIYLLDGSKEEDFIHIAGLLQFANFSWINMIPESILVGVSNVDQKRDFTYPTSIEQDKKDFPTTGGSAAFISFLEKELKPLVEKTYRVDAYSTLIGQSLGGLVATEILYTNPDLFENYIIVSPSLWWDDGSLLNSNKYKTEKNKTIFVAVGKEGDYMERDAMGLYVNLMRSKKEGDHVNFKFLEEQDHGDALHLAVYHAFEKMNEIMTKEQKE